MVRNEIVFSLLEVSHSGLVHHLGKVARFNRLREFESLHLRQLWYNKHMEGMNRKHEILTIKELFDKKVNSWIAKIRTSELPETFKELAETIIENMLKNNVDKIPESKEMSATYELLGALMYKLEKPEEVEVFKKILDEILEDIKTTRASEN